MRAPRRARGRRRGAGGGRRRRARRRRRRSGSRRPARPRAARRSARGRSAQLTARPRLEQRAAASARSSACDVRVGDGDHVAAAVAVEPHGPDRLTDLEVRVRLDHALGGEHAARAPDRVTLPVGSGPGRRRSGSGSRAAAGSAAAPSSSGTSSPSAWRSAISTRSTPTRMADEVGHLAAGDPGRHLDDGDRAVRVRDQLREGDPVAEPERLDGARGDPLRVRRAGRRRSTPGRRGSSRRRSRSRAGGAGRTASAPRPRPRGRSRCPFSSSPSWNLSTIASSRRRLRERGVEVRARGRPRVEAEDAALAA